MFRKPIVVMALLVPLAGCGSIADSRLNPFNWFGGSGTADARTFVPPDPVEADPRPQVAEITSLTLEPTPGGAILRATGLPPTQGYWDGALVAEHRGEPVDGTMTYQFRIQQPAAPWPASTRRSRDVVVGVFLTDQSLRGVSRIVVSAAANSRSVRP